MTTCMECCDHTKCLHIPIDKEEMNGRIKITMCPSRSLEQFYKSNTKTCCSRALHLMQPGLVAGWFADKIQVIFKIFKILF